MSTKKYLYTDNIGDRLKQYRISKGYKVLEFSRMLDISQGSLSGLENNKSKPSAETLANLVLHTDIDLKWLLTGDGLMFINEGDETSTDSNRNVLSYDDKIETEHLKLIKQFKNKELAKNINSKLIKLESIDPDELEDIDVYIDLRISRNKQKKVSETMTRTGEDRRKTKAS